MDFPKRERALHQGSPRRSPKALRPGAAAEADENASPMLPVVAGSSSPQRKKVLGERNDGGGGAGMEAAARTPPPPQQPKPAPSPPTLTGRGAGAYDPKTNYTTPRPEFLRYDPERRREILLRMARAAEVQDDDCSSSASVSAASEDDGGSAASNAVAQSPVWSAPNSDSEGELDDSDDEEEEETPPRRGRWVRRMFLLLVAMACLFCYMQCMNPAAFPLHSEDGLDFSGPIGDMYDSVDREVDSLRLLGPVYMMGPEDVLEQTTDQFVHGENEGAVHLQDQRASSKNLVAVTMMGLSDICLKVPLGELTCQVGSESSKNMYDSELDEHWTGVRVESFETNEQSCMEEGNSGSSHQEEGEEEGNSGSVHQEEGDDLSNPLMLQLVPTGRPMEPASEELNLDSELWQYENTAEAAKTICSNLKSLCSAMEPHLLKILACLSVASFVSAMFSYLQRSRNMFVPVPQQPSRSFPEVPVLIPHKIVQSPAILLPVYSSEQPTQPKVEKEGLSGSLEVPMEFPLPKKDPFVSLKDPVQEPLPKTDTVVSLKVPVNHGNHDKKLQQGDANNMKALSGNFLNHRNVDSSKPPVGELLGELTFANSSRGKGIKNLNQYVGDAAVQESPKKDVYMMQMNSSIVQNPSVRRGEKEENSVKGEKTNTTPAPLTPTPLRRSGRLRNKVTSP